MASASFLAHAVTHSQNNHLFSINFVPNDVGVNDREFAEVVSNGASPMRKGGKARPRGDQFLGQPLGCAWIEGFNRGPDAAHIGECGYRPEDGGHRGGTPGQGNSSGVSHDRSQRATS